MVCYRIGEAPVKCAFSQRADGDLCVLCVTTREWEEREDRYGIRTDAAVGVEESITMAEVGAEALTGCFSVPVREDITGPNVEFAFAMNESTAVFIDDSGYCEKQLERFAASKHWKRPSMGRFLSDFLENFVHNDIKLLQKYEADLERLEDDVLAERNEHVMESLNGIRGDLLDIRTHYEQLIDFGQELEENENCFFDDAELDYFHLFTARVERYRDQVLALREYTSQIRDLNESQNEVRQNKVLALLTILTTVCYPLSIITGWYGMNFVYMPELKLPWAYPALIGICAAIVTGELIYFKKKKWL